MQEQVKNPGPGQYQPNIENVSQKQRMPKYSMASSRKDQVRDSNPPPGTYKVPEIFTKEGPNYSFAQKYQQEKPQLSPGPGAYNPHYSFEKARTAIVTGKSHDAGVLSYTGRCSPGPGSSCNYKTDVIPFENKKAQSIGKEQRDNYYNKLAPIPGPGSYEAKVIKQESPRYRFGSEHRKDPFLSGSPIGPGSYEIKSKLRTDIRISIVPRREDFNLKTANFAPGPGTYENFYLKTRKQSPSYNERIGNSSRNESPNNQNPGPGIYNPIYDPSKKLPAFKIGTSKREEFLNNSMYVPGPGNYDPKYNNEAPKDQFSMVPRRQYNSREISPGPQSYTTGAFNDSSYIRFPSAKRDVTDYTKDFPVREIDIIFYKGPGHYTVKMNENWKLGKIGNSQREFFGLQKGEQPGPGHYSLRPTFADVPSYLLPKK